MKLHRETEKVEADSEYTTKEGNPFTFPEGPLWEPTATTLLMGPHNWLKKKREFDGHGKLWRVNDNLYDLSSFVEKHPGGSDWLSLTQGTDITELFLSSHVVNVHFVESLLKKFYVKPAEGPRKTPYTFHENGFYMTLKRKVEPILRKAGTGPTIPSKLIQDGVGLGFIIFAILGAIFNSYALLITSGIFLYCVSACAHNFFHLKDSWRKYYFDLTLVPSHDFRIVHCVSHHVFTNTRLDYEGMAFEPLGVHRHVNSKRIWQRYGAPIYMNLVFIFGLTGNFFVKMFRIFVLKDHSFRPENAIPFIQFFVLAAFAPSFRDALSYWLVIHNTCSYLLLTIGVTVAHHDSTCFHDGDQIKTNVDWDWGMYQMDTTRDTKKDFSDNLLLTSIAFGEHSLHHLFPTVCHSKYHLLKPILMETMQEFGMEYPRLTRFELFIATVKNLTKNAPNVFCNTLKAES